MMRFVIPQPNAFVAVSGVLIWMGAMSVAALGYETFESTYLGGFGGLLMAVWWGPERLS